MKLKVYRGFSLIETIVSLGIIGIIMVLFFNVITRVIYISMQINARSRAREEISSIVNLIKLDIRNADEIRECSNQKCTIFVEGKTIEWNRCTDDDTRLCRYEVLANQEYKLTYRLPLNYYINYLSFEDGFAESSNSAKRNINFDVSISHQNPNVRVTNVVSSLNISTRNYAIQASISSVCGNGIIEIGEQCDGGPACTNECIEEKCLEFPLSIGIYECETNPPRIWADPGTSHVKNLPTISGRICPPAGQTLAGLEFYSDFHTGDDVLMIFGDGGRVRVDSQTVYTTIGSYITAVPYTLINNFNNSATLFHNVSINSICGPLFFAAGVTYNLWSLPNANFCNKFGNFIYVPKTTLINTYKMLNSSNFLVLNRAFFSDGCGVQLVNVRPRWQNL